MYELRRPFTLPRAEIEVLERGDANIGLDSLCDAARSIAATEDDIVFNGVDGTTTTRLATASFHETIETAYYRASTNPGALRPPLRTARLPVLSQTAGSRRFSITCYTYFGRNSMPAETHQHRNAVGVADLVDLLVELLMPDDDGDVDASTPVSPLGADDELTCWALWDAVVEEFGERRSTEAGDPGDLDDVATIEDLAKVFATWLGWESPQCQAQVRAHSP